MVNLLAILLISKKIKPWKPRQIIYYLKVYKLVKRIYDLFEKFSNFVILTGSLEFCEVYFYQESLPGENICLRLERRRHPRDLVIVM